MINVSKKILCLCCAVILGFACVFVPVLLSCRSESSFAYQNVTDITNPPDYGDSPSSFDPLDASTWLAPEGDEGLFLSNWRNFSFACYVSGSLMFDVTLPKITFPSQSGGMYEEVKLFFLSPNTFTPSASSLVSSAILFTYFAYGYWDELGGLPHLILYGQNSNRSYVGICFSVITLSTNQDGTVNYSLTVDPIPTNGIGVYNTHHVYPVTLNTTNFCYVYSMQNNIKPSIHYSLFLAFPNQLVPALRYGYLLKPADDYRDGYNQGFKDGNQQGVKDGVEQGRQEGYQQGYDVGFIAGAAGADGGDAFLGLFSAVLDAPISAFRGLLNFEVFGVNMASFYLVLLTAAVVVTVVKLILP